MAEIRPIQFETESLQMLSALGDIQEKREILERQRMQEEIKQKRELMDMIDPMTLSKNLESEVVNARMGQLKTAAARGRARTSPRQAAMKARQAARRAWARAACRRRWRCPRRRS